MSPAAVFDEAALVDYVRGQRWFGAKSREVTGATVLDTALLREIDPLFYLVLAELRYPEGTHDIYQLLLGEGAEVQDALADDRPLRELVHMIRRGTMIGAGEGSVEFHPVSGFAAGTELQVGRRIESEQSNTSVVFDDELILKIFRRLEAGLNPELELLRFLTEREFPNIPPLGGWYAYIGRPLEATLGILQSFVPGAIDGWELALRDLERTPESFLGRLRRLGEVTGALHTTLSWEQSDPAFSAEEPSAESLGLLTATIDDEIENVFAELPADNEALAPILGRGEEVRERLRGLTQLGSIGKIIRHHGDYHLGQVLWASGDWLVIDFEGEPARPLPERRRKRSPLRDVAGMLRSFAYAASAAKILRGVEAPPDWEQRTRTEFMDGYMATVDHALLPSGDEAIARLLSIFELEKAVYELRYELDSRPEWVSIPVAGIVRLLES
jgi:trehalose synthase-fused probable maltokinase